MKIIFINYYLKYVFIGLKDISFDFIIMFYCNFSMFLVLFFLNFLFLLKNKRKKILIKYMHNLKYYSFINQVKVNSAFFYIIYFFIFYFLFFINNNFKFSYIIFSKNFFFLNNKFDLNLSFDYINIYFIILTLFTYVIIFLSFKTTKYLNDLLNSNKKFILFIFVFIEFFLILTFCTSNIFFFFFFFECSLIPLYILVLYLGKGLKKKHYASLSLVFFTLTGSVFLLFSILYLSININSFDFKNISYELLDFNTQLILFLFFLIGFAVKIPIFPFYSWLPEAHVEASTSVSILLAAIFLKVATYAMLKIVIFNFFIVINYLYAFIFYFSLFSIILCSFLNLVQTDLKKIIALSSVIHMNYIIIGLFSLDSKAVTASLIYMFSHAFVSSGLFYLVGFIYENTGTRDLLNLNNFNRYSQNIYLYFFLFNLSNLSFPLTISFISELMLLNNLMYLNVFFIAIILISVFISVIYTFWMIHNIFYSKNLNLKNILFLNIYDSFVLFLLMFLVFLFGCLPFIIFYNLEQEIYLILINKFFIF